MAGTNLSRANGSGSATTKFTYSVWLKYNGWYTGGQRFFSATGGSGDTYFRFNEDGTIASFNYNGTSGAAFNTEIDFTAYLPYSIRKNNIASYLFADAGIISNEVLTKENYKTSFSDLRADAGIGFTYTFRNFGPLETVKPLVIRFDMPFFLNRAPASDEDFVQMRWLIGINRVF